MAFIPARGGSKGVRRKNLAHVGGISLVGRAIRLAASISRIDEVVVSSDDGDVLAEAHVHGAIADRRSPTLARDDSPTLDVVREYLDRRRSVEVLIVLQPTSPFRDPVDVETCIDRLATASSAATVAALEHPVEWTFEICPRGRLKPLISWDSFADRRQGTLQYFRLNGAVYAVLSDRIRSGHALVDEETAAVVMPADRSLDIDTQHDLEFARLLFDRFPKEPEAT